MAKLGSTVDARLLRISPYAIRAIEQGGAAMGEGYANLGSTLGKTITSFTTRMRDDKINASLNEALAASMSINPGDGTKTFDRKNFLDLAKGTVPPKAAREFADKRDDLVQKENNIIEQQITRALNQSNIEDELGLKEQELQIKEEDADFRKAELKIATQQKGIENDLRRRGIDIQEKLFDQGEEDRIRKEAAAEAKKLSAQEATERFETNQLKIRGLNAEFEDPNTTPERLREINKELQKLVFSNEALNRGVLSAAQTLQYGIRQDERLFKEPELDIEDQLDAAVRDFYPEPTEADQFKLLLNSNPELARKRIEEQMLTNKTPKLKTLNDVVEYYVRGASSRGAIIAPVTEPTSGASIDYRNIPSGQYPIF